MSLNQNFVCMASKNWYVLSYECKGKEKWDYTFILYQNDRGSSSIDPQKCGILFSFASHFHHLVLKYTKCLKADGTQHYSHYAISFA